MALLLKNVKIEKDSAFITINPRIYSLEAVQAAAYSMIDNSLIGIDEDANSNFTVEIKQKNSDVGLPELASLFQEELLNFAVDAANTKKMAPLNQAILSKALGQDVNASYLPAKKMISQTGAELVCPSCSQQLKATEYGGVVINTCECCDGVWLDKNAVDKVINLSIEQSNGIQEADFVEDPEGIAVPWEEKYKESDDTSEDFSLEIPWKKDSSDDKK